MDPNSALDFTSETFNPVQALQSDSIALPYPKAKTYNNIAEYYSHTFLKSNLGVGKKKLPTKDRNYSYYLDTIGLRGIQAERYLENLNRLRKAKKGIKKKPKNVTYSPGSPLRSKNITNLESKFNEYWKRKQLQYENTKSVTDITTILKRSEDIPLFQKIKSLAKPLTAQELIAKAKQPSSTSSVTEFSHNWPVDKQVPFTTQFEPASSASCTGYLSDDSSGTEELARFCRFLSLRIRKNPLNKETRQSMDFLEVTNLSNRVKRLTNKNVDLKDVQFSKCVNDSEKQNDSTLTPKENVVNSPKELKKLSNGTTKVKVIKRLTSKKTQPSKATLKKENCELLLKQCTCNPKLSMGSHCTCGVYSTAMNNIRKFKIPRKKT